MKVMITGATGFIGNHVVRALLAAGHDIVALVRNPEKAADFGWADQVTLIPHDIHAPTRLELDATEPPDALMHLAWAGLPNYKASFHVQENLPAHRRFLQSLIDQGIGHMVIAGTGLEYGMQSGCLTEDMPTMPITPYGQAKDALRQDLQKIQQTRSLVLQWARFFYMHGSGQHPHSILSQLDKAIARGDQVFDMSGGEQLRDYLPVEEVAHRLVCLLERPGLDGIFNVCNGEPISIRELVEGHLEKRDANIRLNLGHYPYPDFEPMAYWGSPQKLASNLRTTA